MNAPAAPKPPTKDMAGYIAKNSARTKDTQPHWRGKVKINGKEYLLSLWERDGELMSLSVTDPDTLAKRSPAQGAPASSAPAPGTPPSSPEDLGDIFGVLP